MKSTFLLQRITMASALPKPIATPLFSSIMSIIAVLLSVQPVIGFTSRNYAQVTATKPMSPPATSLHISKSLSEEAADEEPFHTLQVAYEGISAEVPVRPGETILSALERSGVPRRLCLPEMPSDCRRGSCLTCAATHASGSEISSLQRGEDGLTPCLSEKMKGLNYVMTCSSTVSGDGVKLELGKNHQAWEDIHRSRLEDDEIQQIAQEAMALTIRKFAERNVQRWTQETEEILRQSGNR